MFAVMLNQPDASFEDMIMHGVTADNTTIRDRDYYKNIDAVKNNDFFKDKDGNFDNIKFNNFYDSVVNAYNSFSKDDYQQKIIDGLAKDPLDWTQPFNNNVKDVSAVITVGKGDFGHRSKGVTGIGTIGDQIFSMREIAQDSRVRDKDGNILDWSPNSRGFFKSIFDPAYVLATYDDNGYHTENGIQVAHKKGDYKIDPETGDPFYEELGDRDPYGKEVLRVTDTLTVDGTRLNKWDFLDSDGLSKSIGSTILQTAVAIAPLFIPGADALLGTVGMTLGLTGALPGLLKGVSSIFVDNESPYIKGLTRAESWIEKWKPTQSDASKGKFMTFENFGQIIRSSAWQLFSQKQVANLSQTLLKGGDGLANTKIGQRLSLGYMALTSSTDTYSAFKEAGANDVVAGLGMLATMGALYELMNIDYFKDALFKGTWLDESEVNNVIKNYSKDNIKRFIEAETGSLKAIDPPATTKEAKTLFTRIKNGWSKFMKSSLSGTPKDLTVPKEAAEEGAKKGARKMLSNFNIILNRSVNEGVEETIEEIAQDLVKGVFSGLDALGVPSTKNPDEDLDFNWSLKDAWQRYITSFGGGFLGGTVFAGFTQYQNRIKGLPTIADFNNTSEQMLYLILSGQGQQIKDRAKMYRDKGVLGDKNLSIKNFRVVDGKAIFNPANGDDNQNDFAYNLITHEVDRLEKILSDSGITENAIARYMTEFAGNIDEELKLNKFGKNNEELNRIRLISSALKKIQLHTTFMDDLVKIAKDIVDVQDQIDILTPTPTTDAQARNQEKQESSEELKRLQNLKQELLAKKEAFLNHENDREYIEQAMFIANPLIQKSMFTLISDGKILDYDPTTDVLNGETGFSNYMLLKYKKNLKDLSKSEKEFYKKEYDAFIQDPTNIRDIQNVGKVLFSLYKELNEDLSSKLIKTEEVFKDTKANPFYFHKTHYDSEEYEKYIKSKNVQFENSKKINELTTKLSSIEDVSSEDYINTLAELQRAKDELDEANNIVERYEVMYDPNKDLFVDRVNTEIRNIHDVITDIVLDIRNLQKLPQDDVIKASIASKFSQILKITTDYFTELKNNNVVSGVGGDVLLRKVLTFAGEIFNKIPESYFFNAKTDESPISDMILSGYIVNTEELYNAYINGFIPLLKEALEKGDLDLVLRSFDNLKSSLRNAVDWTDESGNSLSDEEIDKELDRAVDELQKVIFGDNLVNFIQNTNELVKSVKTYGLSDLLSDINITVGDDIKPVLDFLDEQKKSLIAVDIEKFILTPNIKSALYKISSLLQLIEPIIQSAYDGTNHTINLLSKNDKDVKLAEISENTKNRLVEDFDYLRSVVDTLLKIEENNDKVKKDYAIKSEVTFHRNFMNNVLNGSIDNEATWVGKFYKWFGINIKDLWKQAGDETGKTIELPTINEDDYADYKERFIRFWSLLRKEALAGKLNEDGTRTPISIKEIGILLGSSLSDSSARLNEYGEVNAGEHQGDEAKNNLTNLGTTVVIGALLNEDYESWYKDYIVATEEEDYPYIELMQQELATHIGYEFAISENGEDSIFNGIINGIKESRISIPDGVKEKSDKEEHFNSIKTLENLFYVDGGTGSGKSTATAFLTYKMLKNRAENNGKKIEIVVAVPTEKQMKGDSGLLKVEKSKLMKHIDLMKTIGGTVDGATIYQADLRTVSDKDSKTNKLFVGGDPLDTKIKDTVVPDGDIKQLYSEDDSLKYIFIDEAQHMNQGALMLLNKYAEQNGIKILMYGDKRQNGAQFNYKSGHNEGFSEDNVNNIIVLSSPTLGESLRFENYAKQVNYKSLKTAIDEIEEAVKKEYAYEHNEIKDIAKNVIDNRSTTNTKVSLKYYEDNDTFVGEKQIPKENIDAYVQKFKRLSKALGKDTADICIIVANPDDKLKYLSEDVTVLTEEEVLTAREVQGNEYDFVIIDKSFDTDNLLLAYKDLYTLMGRSKIGTVIATDIDTDLKILNEVKDKTYTAKVNSDEDFKSFGEKKTKVFDRFRPEKKEKSKEKDESKKGEEKKPTPKNDSSTGFSGLLDELPIETPVLDIESKELPKRTVAESTTQFFDAVDKTRTRIKKDINDSSEPRFSYDWNDYVEWAETELLTSEGLSKNSTKSIKTLSILSEVNKITGDTVRDHIKTFFRKFASAVVYNMQIQSYHKETFRNLLPSGINVDQIVDAWNKEISNGSHTFIAAPDNESNKTAIYWRLNYNGKIKYIPIAIVDGTFQGTVTVSGKTSIFEKAEELWALRSDPKDGNTSVQNRDTKVGIVSQSKILSVTKKDIETVGNPSDSLGISTDDTKKWLDDTNGRSQALVTDCEILQDEDFAQIFKVKTEDSRILYGFNVDSIQDDNQIPDEVDEKSLKSYQKNRVSIASINGAKVPVLSINTHKYVSLSTLYNLANIGRYAAGQITFDALSKNQKTLIGGYDSKAAAVKFVETYLGEFNINIADSHLVEEEQRQQAENKRKLGYDYRLLTEKASYSLLGVFTSAINTFDKAAQDKFYTSILKSLVIEPQTIERSQITYKQGLYFNFPIRVGNRTVYKKLFISLGQDKNSKSVIGKVSELKGYKAPFEWSKDLDGTFNFGKIEDITFNDIIEQVLDKFKDYNLEGTIDENLLKGKIQISLMQRQSHPERGITYKINDDYNLVTAIFSGFREDSDFINKLEELLTNSSIFRDGITLNDNRVLSDEAERSREENKWADTRNINPNFIRSNLRRIEGRIWSLKTNNGELLFDGSDTGVTFKYKTDAVTEVSSLFEPKNISWEGSKLICNAKVDSEWLSRFTEEKEFTTESGKPVNNAVVNSIDFSSGKIILTIGMNKQTATLGKNNSGQLFNVSEVSNNKISDSGNLPTINGIVSITVKDNVLYAQNKKLTPLFELDEITYYVSEDGSSILPVSKEYQKTANLKPNVSKVKRIGKGLFKDLSKNVFYTDEKMLGKIANYSNNFIIFDTGNSIDYELFDEKYIPKEYQLQHQMENQTPVKNHTFVNKPNSKILKNPYVSKINNSFILFGESWIVNGAWLYNNTDYSGINESFVNITEISIENGVAKIKTSSGNEYILNPTVDLSWLTNAPIDGDIQYLIDTVLTETSLNRDSLHFENSSFENLIQELNNKLQSEGVRIEYDVDNHKLNIIKTPREHLLIMQYANKNNIELTGDIVENSDGFTIVDGIDKDGKKIGIYYYKDKIFDFIPTSEFNNEFIQPMLRLLSSNPEFKVVYDEFNKFSNNLSNLMNKNRIDWFDNFFVNQEGSEWDNIFELWDKIKPILDNFADSFNDATDCRVNL